MIGCGVCMFGVGMIISWFLGVFFENVSSCKEVFSLMGYQVNGVGDQIVQVRCRLS